MSMKKASETMGESPFKMPDAAYFEESRQRLADDRAKGDKAQMDAREKTMREACVPPLYLDTILPGLVDESAAVLQVRKFMASKLSILILCGDVGVGKSYAACTALEGGGLFILSGDVLCMSDFDKEGRDALRSAQVLVLDDLSTEYTDSKGHWLSRVDTLVNARYLAKLRTIITSNLTPELFAERYGERIADRIRDVGCYGHVTGESRRRK